MIALDTNILIGYFNGDPKIVPWLEGVQARQEALVLSTIVLVELFGYSKITPSEKEAIEVWIKHAVIIDVGYSIALFAGNLRKEKHLTTTDSIIAATAMTLKIPLATMDKEFRKVAALKIVEI